MMMLRFLLLTGLLLAPSSTTQSVARDSSLKTFDAVWNIVKLQHFDPDLNGVDWDAVRTELRPRAASAQDREELREVIRDMLGRLGQSHFWLNEQEQLGTGARGSESSPAGTCGFDLRLRAGQALVTRIDPGGPADRAGIGTGWLLRGIDRQAWGLIVQRMKREKRRNTLLRDETLHRGLLMTQVDGAIGTTAEFTFTDGADHEQVIQLERVKRAAIPFNLPGLPTSFLEVHAKVIEQDGRRYGLLRFSEWLPPIRRAIDQALVGMRDCDGILIDLRSNTGGDGDMPVRVAGHFFTAPNSLGKMKLRDRDRELVIRPRRAFFGRVVEPYHGPLAILVDETTGSASELFCGGMQSNGRAKVIGVRTIGAVLPALMTPLPNGDFLVHAVAEYLTPTGESLEASGVVPDIVVDLDRTALLRGRDLVLEAAITWAAQARGD